MFKYVEYMVFLLIFYDASSALHALVFHARDKG